MSDEKRDEQSERPRLVRGSGLVGPDGRTPASRRDEKARKQRPPTIEEVQQWITVGSLAIGKKVYEEIAAEHARVFEVQEAGFMLLLEQFHTRLCVLEEVSGLASPAVGSFRETMEAIGDYFGDVANGDEVPWAERPHHERVVIIANRILDLRERSRTPGAATPEDAVV